MARPKKNSPPKPEVILDAATELLLRDGYGTTTIEAIAKEAGVSKATYYRHFADKKAVLKAVIRRAVSRAPVKTAGDELVRLKPEIALRRFAEELLASLASPHSLGMFRLIISEAGRSPELGQLIFREMTGVAATPLSTYLESLSEAGVLKIPDPALAAFEFIGAIKEPLFWPRLFGMIRAPVRSSQASVIDQAVHNFLKAHRP